MRELLFSVVDRNYKCVKGALVRFHVNNKLLAEARQQEDTLRFAIDDSVEIVDVEVFFGALHEWTKVPMSAGTYQFQIDRPTGDLPTNPDNREAAGQSGQHNAQSSGGGNGNSGGKWWIAIVVAVIGAIATLVVGYWQWHKPDHQDNRSDQVQLRIVVKEATDTASIANASVQIEDGSHHQEDTTDATGSTKQFSFSKTGSSTLRVIVDASQYENTIRNLDRPNSDQTYTIALKRVTQNPTGGKTTTRTRQRLDSTWEIEAPSDPNSARISKGTFTFVPQGDGSAVVSAQFVGDGTAVTLGGTAGTGGRQVHISFRATTAEGGSWNGTGDFTFSSATKMTGRIQSKRGDDVGLTLVKQ